MSRSWIWLLPLCAVLGLGACGDSGSDNDPDPDGSNNTDDPTKDPDDPDKELGSSELADLCSKNEECSSGLCVSLGQGVNDSLCSKRCEEASDCGESSVWDCTEVDTSADQINVCVPKDLCLDNDNDGYGVGPGCLGPDCDDDDPTVYFGAPEICDGKDNDCNDDIDDNPVDVGVDCDTSYEGVCKTGVSYCDDGELKCEALIQPGQQREICDGLDNDCDGYVDESPLDPGGDDGNYVDGTGRACSKGGSEECLNGLSVCDPDQGIICESNDNILDDTCDGIDDNCSGRIDDDVEGLNEPCIAGEGECQVHGHTVCDADPYDPPICDAEPDDSKISPEICDYKDNNCDGDVDEGFVNDDGVYYRVEHCGACDLNCNDRWVDNDFAHTVTPTCDVQGQNTQCGYECKPGFIDADGDASNGCELEENPEALYVAPVNKGGSDNGFCGDYDRPCATISRAIELLDDYDAANEPRTEILVAEGIYREGITLPDGVDVKGGHNALNWLNNVEEYRTIIVGSVNDDGDRYTVLAEDIQQPTELSGFTILGEDAQNGANSIGVFVRNASDKLTIKDNVIRAGVGGQGVSGDAGSDGDNGSDGLPGLAGAEVNVSSCSSSDERDGGQAGTSSCGSSDVSGGLGAAAACPSYGQPGATASDGKGAAPGSGGLTAAGRGLFQNACYPHPDHISESFPSDGAFGDAGTDGGGGDGADDSEGSIDSDGMWRGVSGAQGASGDNGSGGGGGGASHGTMKCDSIDADGRIFEDCDTVGLIGSSGGGGGAGGCSGNGADGGGGGGGSFSIYVYADASGASLPTITDNTLERNLGGQGGDGGIGGRGGDGGGGGVGGPAPAQPTYCPQAGRSGGNGGRGGHGGGGGGGAGGASFDIAIFGLSANASDLQSANEFSIDSDEDTGGSGGPGGGSMGQSGSQGTTGSFGQFINP